MPILGPPSDEDQLRAMIEDQIARQTNPSYGQPLGGNDPYVEALLKRMMAPPPEKPKEESKGKKARFYIGSALSGIGDALAMRAAALGAPGLKTDTLQMLQQRRMMQQQREEEKYQQAVKEQEVGKREAAGELYRIRTAKKAEEPKLDPYQQKEAAVKRMRAMGLNVTPKQEYDFYTGAHGDADPVAQMIKAAQLGGMGVVPEGLSPDLQAIATQAKTFEEKKPSRTASTAEGKVGGMSPTSIMSQLRLNYNNLLIEMGAPLRRTTVTTYDADGYPTQTEVMVPVATPEQRTAAAKRTLNRFPKEVRAYILREMPDWQEQLQPTPAAPKTTEEEFLSR